MNCVTHGLPMVCQKSTLSRHTRAYPGNNLYVSTDRMNVVDPRVIELIQVLNATQTDRSRSIETRRHANPSEG